MKKTSQITKIHQKWQKIHQIHQNPPKIIYEFCNNNFTRSDSLNRHYNRCKLKKNQDLILEQNQNEKIIKMEKEITELKKNKTNIQNNTNITTIIII